MNKTYILPIISIFIIFQVAAQVPLTLPTNALRHGDVLCKIQMPYVAPGDVGEGEVWHLGTVSDDYPDFMQENNSNGDTIAVYEAERIQHYVVRGDTLLDKGEQSRRAHYIYNVERPMLHEFPETQHARV